MKRIQFYKKSDCLCGKCGRIFNYQEARESPTTRKLYGIEIKEVGCPYCGSKGYTPMGMLGWVEKYLFIN